MMMVDGGCDFVLLCSYPGLHFMFALRAIVMAYDSNAYDIMVNNGNRSTKSDFNPSNFIVWGQLGIQDLECVSFYT